MTRIDFYFNVSNKPQLLAELVQGALHKRRQVTVTVDDAKKANEISANLWQHTTTSFIPNVLAHDALAAQTPMLMHWQDNTLLQNDMLINLTQAEPSFFSRFTQLIEMIGLDDDDKSTGRRRYKFYRDRGYEIKTSAK